MTVYSYPQQGAINVTPAPGADLASETTLSAIETLITDRLTGSFVPKKFDYVGYTDGGSTETYVYKTGGAGGTTQKTVTVTYSDATKAVLVSIAAT